MKTIFNFILLLILVYPLSATPTVDRESYQVKIEKSIHFFDQAYDSDLGVYYSEVDNQGKVTSSTIFNVALSRSIYGLSYASSWNKTYLDRAKKCINYQLSHLVIKDEKGWYFAPSTKQTKAEQNQSLDIWQQAYGLCGLTEYYRQTKDKEVLESIQKLHKGFIGRFYDQDLGGFCARVDRSLQDNNKNRSIQSLMYPITAYLGNLWLADSLHRDHYEPIISKTLERVYQIAWNKELGWVNTDFDSTWKMIQKENPQATPGHSFQLASLLLRTKHWHFIAKSDREKYCKLGEEILAKAFEKPIFDEGKHAFYSLINVKSNEVVDRRKTWWQQAEAVLALSLSEKDYQQQFDRMLSFFDQNYVDHQYGGEYFYVSEFNVPDKTQAKGSIGKSVYHTVEMFRFCIEE